LKEAIHDSQDLLFLRLRRKRPMGGGRIYGRRPEGASFLFVWSPLGVGRRNRGFHKDLSRGRLTKEERRPVARGSFPSKKFLTR